MARKKTTNSRTTASRASSTKGASKNSTTAKPGARPASQHRSVIDARSKRDIRGVACIVAAIVLLVAALVPQTGVVTKFIHDALHLTLGVGTYILPLFLLVVGISFIVRQTSTRLPVRVSLGLAMIFVALLSILALNTPGAAQGSTANLFIAQNLTSLGGYIGAGIAWCGITLFGHTISLIILIGVIIAGFIVVGLSLHGLIEKIKERREANLAESALASPEYETFPRRGQSAPFDAQYGYGTVDDGMSSAKTRLIGHRNPSQAGNASSAVTVAFDKDVANRDTISLDGEAKPMTRKLGKRDIPDSEVPQEKQQEGAPSDSASDDAPKHTSVKLKALPTMELAAPLPMEGFTLPDAGILSVSRISKKSKAHDDEYMQTAEILQETLEDFGVFANVVGWVAGPTVTLYKVDLPAGTRVSKVSSLSDDIARSLAAAGVRIFAPIPGTTYVGIEVPNQTRQTVLLGDVLPHAGKNPLEVAIGKDVEGNFIVSDLAKMPHLLIGGTTGSGKSVSINGMIMSILMRCTPAEVRMILIDPKRVEFMPYNGIPHLYVPVVTEPKEAAAALNWGVAEMEHRLKVFSKVGARNIGQYNAKVQNGEIEPNADGQAPAQLPYIVIVIDELADLMMNCGKEVEFAISRIAQLARAAGIHLIIATQRPSANVVTGLIKANITSRIALNVASSIDSRVILDQTGAESLVGNGDLLFNQPEFPKPLRIQGCYVSEEEIYNVVEHLKEQAETDYHTEILKTNMITLGDSMPDGSGGSVSSDDPLLWEAADIVVSSNLGSTSSIQRRLKVGYSRAGRIMDMLEEKGIVGPPNGSKPRDVLVDSMELEALKAFEARDAQE